MYDISIYGLGKKRINYDLSDLSNNQPTWNDLIPLKDKIPGLDDFRLLTRDIEDVSGSRWLPAFQWDSLLSSGSYGKIYKGLRAVYVNQGNYQYKLLEKQETIVLKEVEVEKNLKRTGVKTPNIRESSLFRAVVLGNVLTHEDKLQSLICGVVKNLQVV